MTAKVGRALGFFVAVAVACVVASSVVMAQTRTVVCGQRQQIVDYLAAQYHQTRDSSGLSSSGWLLEVYVSSTGTWTIVMSSPKGTACMVDAGDGWDRDRTAPTQAERGT
jgi:hypothetical protein